jgi:hypothetical protein
MTFAFGRTLDPLYIPIILIRSGLTIGRAGPLAAGAAPPGATPPGGAGVKPGPAGCCCPMPSPPGAPLAAGMKDGGGRAMVGGMPAPN